MKRQSRAAWEGGLKSGKGQIWTESGALSNARYSFITRFEDDIGTNPEELIAAAHAGCFSMALAGELEKAGLKPREVQTTATVKLEKSGDGWSIEEVHLSTRGTLDGEGNQREFENAANRAKENCPVSRALKVRVTLDVQRGAEAADTLTM